jgi:hypothetical protein
MLRGFVIGAPAGQDWGRLASEFQAAMAATGKECDSVSLLNLSGRWLKEEPAAALDWVAGHVTLAQIEQLESPMGLPRDPSADPYAFPGDPAEGFPFTGQYFVEEELPDEFRIPLYLLDRVVQANEPKQNVALLAHMLTGNHDDLALLVIRKQFKGTFSPSDIPLLRLLPAIPDPEQRQTLLHDAVWGVSARPASDDPFSNIETASDPKISIETIRSLAAELDLPSEIRGAAEARFAEVLAQDQKAMEERARWVPSSDDLFGPKRPKDQ